MFPRLEDLGDKTLVFLYWKNSGRSAPVVRPGTRCVPRQIYFGFTIRAAKWRLHSVAERRQSRFSELRVEYRWGEDGIRVQIACPKVTRDVYGWFCFKFVSRLCALAPPVRPER